MPRSINAAEVAASVLREHELPAVGWGDSWLLHEIATRLGVPHEGPRTEMRVLNRIDRSNHGTFLKQIVAFPEPGLGRTRRFVLR